LPCAIWFFDRSKELDADRADKTLMLDLRDVCRKVSSNLHDFTDEQLQNIHAIVALYRGDKSLFRRTLDSYKQNATQHLKEANTILKAMVVEKLLTINSDVLKPESVKEEKRKLNIATKKQIEAFKAELKTEEIKKGKTLKKQVQDKIKSLEEFFIVINKQIDQHLYFIKEVSWLEKRFPDGVYTDVAGLCKVVNRSEVKTNDYSLTAGRYVGIAPIEEEEGFDFDERMAEIKQELHSLNKDAVDLAQQIQIDLTELGV
jgi:type I restriction enzyme M protein